MHGLVGGEPWLLEATSENPRPAGGLPALAWAVGGPG